MTLDISGKHYYFNTQKLNIVRSIHDGFSKIKTYKLLQTKPSVTEIQSHHSSVVVQFVLCFAADLYSAVCTYVRFHIFG